MKRALTEAALSRAAPNWNDIVSLTQTYSSAVLGVASLFGNTPLHIAAYHGKPEYASLMLHRGADPNANQRLGCEVPLHLCSMCEDDNAGAAVARTLIQHGANLDALCDWGRTPLYWAVLLQKSELVRILLEGGANATLHYSADKEHVLHLAASRGHFTISRLVVRYGGRKLLLEAVRGELPTQAALRAGNSELAEWLAEMASAL